MRFIIYVLMFVFTSCYSSRSIVDSEKSRINLNDFGTHIEILGEEYGGILTIFNSHFFDELTYTKRGSGVSSTSVRRNPNMAEIYNRYGERVGIFSSGFGDVFLSNPMTGEIYGFRKIHNNSRTYLILENGDKVGVIRMFDERRISVILYKEIDFDIIIHSIYYLE